MSDEKKSLDELADELEVTYDEWNAAYDAAPAVRYSTVHAARVAYDAALYAYCAALEKTND